MSHLDWDIKGWLSVAAMTFTVNVPFAFLGVLIWLWSPPMAVLCYLALAAIFAIEDWLEWEDRKARGYGGDIDRSYFETGLMEALLWPLFWLEDVRIETAWWWYRLNETRLKTYNLHGPNRSKP